MKKIIAVLLSLLAAAPLGAAPAVAPPLKIVATTPDLADVVKQIGKDFVSVESLTKGTEDIHAVPQRPSFLPKLNRADGLVHLGLGAEHAFLPALLEAAANPAILPGQKGDINTSKYIQARDIPPTLSRSEGEQHPNGNPHYNIDPRSAGEMARAVAEGLTLLDPTHAADYEKNGQAFVATVDAKISQWKQMAASFNGTKAVSYHRDMIYFADFLGIALIGEVESKPGIAPTPRHLEDLVLAMKTQKVPLILHEIHFPDKTSRWLSSQTGAKIAIVSIMGNAFPGAETYVGMIDHNVKAVVDALAKGNP